MSGSRLVREGTLGLFIILGFFLFGSVVLFLRGNPFRNQTYELNLEFENAGGLREGGRILYRGVEVGTIQSIEPSVQGVKVVTEVDRNIKIPRNVVVETTQSGLLGEVLITITPQEILSSEALNVDPTSDECPQQNQLLCNGDTLSGEYIGDLIANMTRLSNVFADPVFLEDLNSAIVNIAIASENVAQLSSQISDFTENAGDDISQLSSVANSIITTSESLNTTANTATQQINRLSDDFSQTNQELAQLTRNTNELIENNRANLSIAIVNLADASREVTNLVENANNVVSRVDQTVANINTEQVGDDLQQTIANLEEVTSNLTALSQQLNNPTNLVTLQQTLDSARVTFANTAKITSDIDELTGDPQFRLNMRRLIDGLSNLVSYTDILEKQVELTQLLENIEPLTQTSSPNPRNINNRRQPNIVSSNSNQSSDDSNNPQRNSR